MNYKRILSVLLFLLSSILLIFLIVKFIKHNSKHKFAKYDNKGFNTSFYAPYKHGLCDIKESYIAPKIIENFLSKKELEYVKKLAIEKGFDYSRVKDQQIDEKYRKSKQAWLDYNEKDPIMKNIYEKYAKLINVPINSIQPIQVVKYGRGGFFKPHYDQCEAGDVNMPSDWCNNDTKNLGARYMNLAFYLNKDDFKGGATYFPNLKKKFKPAYGDALLFAMLNEEGTKVHPLSYHGGENVLEGEKWFVNFWCRKPLSTSPISSSNNKNEY